MAELSQLTQRLIQKYQSWNQSLQPKEGAITIHVDEVASTVAAFYEKIREVVDWKEEHLMKRAAIERILKRRLFLVKEGEDIAESIIMELIRGGHFPNDRIPESKIPEVQKTIEKYIYILEKSPTNEKANGQAKINLFDWILGIAACEIEEILAYSFRENALIEYMTDSMTEKVKLRKGIISMGGMMSEEEKNDQVYIAVQRALLKLDSPIISYNLLKRQFPQWVEFVEPNPELQQIAQDIYGIWENIEKKLNHPLGEKFYKVAEKYDTPYLVMGDIISEDPSAAKEKMSAPEALESLISQAYERRLRALKTRTRRAAFYATLSIFITKVLLALAIEVPFDRYVLEQFNYYTLGLNILIPPILMFFLVLTIRPPKKENLQHLIVEIMKITYNRERKDVYTVEYPRKRGWLMNTVITLIYLSTFIVSFGAIIWALQKFDFSILSIAIFLVFISLISFAGVKIRERSKELEIMEKRESILVAFIDLFSLPIIRVGKWLSGQWAKYNILIIIINFLIDMPFQRFVEFLEHWRAFLKEKKEEIH